jgi:hypothetical protein
MAPVCPPGSSGSGPDGSVRAVRMRFSGEIAGAGSDSGVRLVVGRWEHSPYGGFADVMVETATGHRVLLAPSQQVADLVAATYVFDEVRLEPVTAERSADRLVVRTPSLCADLAIGRPTLLGRLVALVPTRIAASPAWCRVTDPIARVVLRGVRTRGTAGGGRQEFYGATGVRAVTGLRGSWEGARLGGLAPVDPPCRFGFSSTPRRPSATTVVTTIDLPD